MRSNVDAGLMTLLWVFIYVKGWPAPYNFRCVYLPLVWILIIPNPSCRPSRVWIAIEWRSNVDAVLMTLLRVLFSYYLRTIGRCPVPYNMRCVYLPVVWRNYYVSSFLPSKPCLNNNRMIIHLYPFVYAVKCWLCADGATVSAHLRKRETCTVQLSLCVLPLGVEISPTLMLVAVQAVFIEQNTSFVHADVR